jgi:hypothetical protein
VRVARTFLAVCALGTLVLGCGKSPLRPAQGILPFPVSTRNLVMDLTLSDSEGSLANPITIHASIRNVGTASVYFLQGGGLCQGIKIDVLDAAGQPVALVDPCQPVPVPLCVFPSLGPGEFQETSLPFNGDIYHALPADPWCQRVDAPTGTYTVTVGFRVYWNAIDPPELLERRVTFHWTGS